MFDAHDWGLGLGFSTGDSVPSVLAPVPVLSGDAQGQAEPLWDSRASALAQSCRGLMLQDAEITLLLPGWSFCLLIRLVLTCQGCQSQQEDGVGSNNSCREAL